MTIACTTTLSAGAADALIRFALDDGDGVIGLAEMIVSPGGGATRSIRPGADEMIRVTSGQLTLTCGGQRMELAAGDAVVVPHGTPRTVENRSDADARAISVIVPLGAVHRPVRRRPAPALVRREGTALHAAA